LTAALFADGVKDAVDIASEMEDKMKEYRGLSRKFKKCRDSEKSKVKTEKGLKVTEKKIEDTAMHIICDKTEVPKTMSACAQAKTALAIATACLAARLAINKKWYNGKIDAAHKAQNEQVKDRIKNATNNIAKYCGKK